jgi:hypothetical protein
MADGWRHYFPAGSLDARPDLHRFTAEWFAQPLERLCEKPLHPAGPHQPLVIRLLCLPTWDPACSVRSARAGVCVAPGKQSHDLPRGPYVGSQVCSVRQRRLP